MKEKEVEIQSITNIYYVYSTEKGNNVSGFFWADTAGKAKYQFYNDMNYYNDIKYPENFLDWVKNIKCKIFLKDKEHTGELLPNYYNNENWDDVKNDIKNDLYFVQEHDCLGEGELYFLRSKKEYQQQIKKIREADKHPKLVFGRRHNMKMIEYFIELADSHNDFVSIHLIDLIIDMNFKEIMSEMEGAYKFSKKEKYSEKEFAITFFCDYDSGIDGEWCFEIEYKKERYRFYAVDFLKVYSDKEVEDFLTLGRTDFGFVLNELKSHPDYKNKIKKA